MSYQITLDSGTTNTRAVLWENKSRLVSQHKCQAGVSCTAVDGNNLRLKQAVKECVDSVIRQGEIEPHDVECVIASGMITSGLGLYEVPHLTAPVGLDDFATGIKKVEFKDICPAPFLFIPGMKNCVEDLGLNNFEAMDIMRGEEVEAIALIDGSVEACVLALPGSHTKFIAVENGMLTGCLTTLSGELLSAITQHTILADTVEGGFASKESYDRDMVILGYRTAKKSGLARAAFAARTLKQQAGRTSAEMASYLLGAVLEQDVLALRNSAVMAVNEETHIIIGGASVLCRGLADVINAEDFFKNVATVDLPLSAKGALAVYEKYEKINK